MLFLWCRWIGDFEHSDWSVFKNHWRHCRGKFIKVVVLLTTFLTFPLHPLPHCLSLSFLALIPLHPPPHYLSLSFLCHPPHYRSPSFLSTSLLASSPSFLSILLTTSLPPSSQSSSPPLHPSFLSIRHLITSSLSCNIIIHLITSVFLPSSSSLLTLPNYLLRILFSSILIIIILITSSSLLLSSFTFVTSSFLSSSFKSSLHLFHYFLIIILLTISILFHIDSLPNSSPSSSLFYTSISPSSSSSFYHSPSVLSILLFIFLPSCPLPHTCQLCLQALSKLEFFSLALRKIALSLKIVFPILSSYLLIRFHSMFMLALVITIIIVDTLFRPHLTIMSSTIYMYISVHKKNPIKIGEGKN